MLIFLGFVILAWVVGGRMGLPRQARWLMIALAYVGILAALIALPEDSPLRAAFGEPLAVWGALGLIAVVVWGYRHVLGRLKSQAAQKEAARAPAPPSALSEAELNRYARHIMLREIGGLGQKKLSEAHVLVVGAGGLGSPALLYLAAAGVGTIGVIDDDVVEASNLQRQVLHSDDRIGMPKVFSAEQALCALNPHITVRPYHRRLEGEIVEALLSDYDLVLDGTDNFATRRLVNQAAVAAKIPLIAAAITQWEGQITTYDPARAAPCFNCVFPHDPAPGLAPSCAEAGVLSPLPGVLGTMMAAEAIKLITGAGQDLRGRILIYDALWGETRQIACAPTPDCTVCGQAEPNPSAPPNIKTKKDCFDDEPAA